MFGDIFSIIEFTIIPDYKGFLLMILPPGAFIALGFILAGKRIIDARTAKQDANELPVLDNDVALDGAK
jgi:electron transport complex protein RnfE